MSMLLELLRSLRRIAHTLTEKGIARQILRKLIPEKLVFKPMGGGYYFSGKAALEAA